MTSPGAIYRSALPQRTGDLFITDGGLETDLIFHEGLTVPSFASFVLLDDPAGREALRRYFRRYAALARDHRVGLVLDTVTWRSNPDWGAKLGYSREALADIDRRSVDLLREVREEYANEETRIVISACIGPRGDGYAPGATTSSDEAEWYHAVQIGNFRDTAADLVSALTMNHVEEAIGIARAATSFAMPVVISFTVERDGALPTGQPLGEAIRQVDAATNGAPTYYMVNCAHPTHIAGALADDGPWLDRVRGVRANASRKSHAELDASSVLDEGDPAELAKELETLLVGLRNLNVLGGCCGTDHRHVEAICRAGVRRWSGAHAPKRTGGR